MSEMIERVAKALADIQYANIGGADSTSLGKPAWTYCVREAKAAIEAMQEPTKETLEAGRKAADLRRWAWTGSDHCLDGMDIFVDAAYRAMVRTALGQ